MLFLAHRLLLGLLLLLLCRLLLLLRLRLHGAHSICGWLGGSSTPADAWETSKATLATNIPASSPSGKPGKG